MSHQPRAAPLTEARIRRILELEPELRRRTKKDRTTFLDVPRLPDVSTGETLTEIVAPQMRKYFVGWNEDPARFLNDRSRMLMIFLAIKSGGVDALRDKYRQLASGALLRSAISDMRERGFGSPDAAEEMLPQAIRNAEEQLRQLQSVSPEEEAAVKICMKEIEKSISRRGKK